MKKFVANHKTLIAVIFLFVIATTIIFSCSIFFPRAVNPNAVGEINIWLYFITGTGTVILAFMAWSQLDSLQRQSKGNFLLHIDERWGNPDIIKARILIHDIYQSVYANNPNRPTDWKHEAIGKQIITVSEDSSKKEAFIYMLNFLDFMETIGYIASQDHVSYKELDALCGESLIFNYRIFMPYIVHKRAKHDNKEFYKNFEMLYDKLVTG